MQKFYLDLQVLQVLQVGDIYLWRMDIFKRGVRDAKNISWYKYFGGGRKAWQLANFACLWRFFAYILAYIIKKR